MPADFRSLLLADAGVSSVVGSRISWGVRPQGSALPAIVMHLIDAPVIYHLSGEGGPKESRIQIDCLAFGTLLNAMIVGDAVSLALSGYSGTVGGTQFQGIFQDSARDLSETGAAEQQVFLFSIDFLARHQPQ